MLILYTVRVVMYILRILALGSTFIDCKYFSSCFVFKLRKRDAYFEIRAKLLQNQTLANNIKICYLYVHCTLLSATLKFNFEPLFDFIKIFENN